MEVLIIWAFMLFVAAPIVVGLTVPPIVRHYKTTTVCNHDPAKMRFVYKLAVSSEELINTLHTTDDLSILTFKVDTANGIMRIAENGAFFIAYYYDMEETNGGIILRLEQRSYFTIRQQISYKLNPFFVNTFSAELLPFEEYGFDHLRE